MKLRIKIRDKARLAAAMRQLRGATVTEADCRDVPLAPGLLGTYMTALEVCRKARERAYDEFLDVLEEEVSFSDE